MTFDEFVKAIRARNHEYYAETDRLKRLFVLCTGLAGETGEALEHPKKFIRDDGRLDAREFKLELGDIICYWVQLCDFFGYDLEEILAMNHEKITQRMAEGRGKKK